MSAIEIDSREFILVREDQGIEWETSIIIICLH